MGSGYITEGCWLLSLCICRATLLNISHVFIADMSSITIGNSTVFTKMQTLPLEEHFKFNIYTDKSTIKQLAKRSKLSERQVYNWFERKRRKLKPGKCEVTSSTCVHT